MKISMIILHSIVVLSIIYNEHLVFNHGFASSLECVQPSVIQCLMICASQGCLLFGHNGTRGLCYVGKENDDIPDADWYSVLKRKHYGFIETEAHLSHIRSSTTPTSITTTTTTTTTSTTTVAPRITDPLERIIPIGTTQYKAYVKTGNQDKASTDSTITFIIRGAKGQFEHLLDVPFFDDFQQNAQDTFTFNEKDVGHIVDLRLHVVRLGFDPSWYCEKVMLTTHTHKKYGIKTSLYMSTVKKWFAPDVGLDFFRIDADEKAIHFTKIQ